MSGKTNFSLSKIVEGLGQRAKNFFNKSKRKVFIVVFIGFLYLFIVIVYKTSAPEPTRPSDSKKYSNLYLMEFIGGYRDYQQDFEIKHIRFGEKFLNFTIDIKFKAKSNYIIKKLIADIILGLIEEYPELESVLIEVIKESSGGSIVVYGRAIYSREDKDIRWEYH